MHVNNMLCQATVATLTGHESAVQAVSYDFFFQLILKFRSEVELEKLGIFCYLPFSEQKPPPRVVLITSFGMSLL